MRLGVPQGRVLAAARGGVLDVLVVSLERRRCAKAIVQLMARAQHTRRHVQRDIGVVAHIACEDEGRCERKV